MTNTADHLPAATDQGPHTFTVQQFWDNRVAIQTRTNEGWSHITAINNTFIDPPMSIEDISPRDEDFEAVRHDYVGPIGGIDVTVWPQGGWMVSFGFALHSGPAKNLITVVRR